MSNQDPKSIPVDNEAPDVSFLVKNLSLETPKLNLQIQTTPRSLSSPELRESILTLLKDPQEKKTAEEIAQEIIGPSAKAKEVNSLLYTMLGQSLVIHHPDGKWSIKTRDPLQSEIEDKILNFLRENPGPQATLEVARHVLNPQAKAKDINPSLYRLLKEVKITKQSEADGTKPRWSII